MNLGVLGQIMAARREEVELEKSRCSLDTLRRQCQSLSPTRGFADALRQRSSPPAIIAELKYASPSRGAIRDKRDVGADACAYRDHGATCLSVLTERRWFGGALQDLKTVRDHVDLPLLRKDFMVDPWQIYQSRQSGADAILLILAALEPSQCREMADLARHLGMDVLAEVHDRAQLDQALKISADMIGVNNRNLKTLKIDLSISEELIPVLKKYNQGHDQGHDIIRVCESGLRSSDDLLRMHRLGADAFLIGESLMSQDHPGMALASWIDRFEQGQADDEQADDEKGQSTS